MKPLPEAFEGTRDQSGYVFKLLKRQGKVALLEKTKPSTNPTGKFYEAVILKTVAEKRWPDGRVTPTHESMPSPEEWGVSGYSYGTLDRAEERFRELCGRVKTNDD